MRTQLLQIRMSDAEKKACQIKADAAGKALAEWAREQLGMESPERGRKVKAAEVVAPVLTNPYPNAVIPKGAVVITDTTDTSIDDDIAEARRQKELERLKAGPDEEYLRRMTE